MSAIVPVTVPTVGAYGASYVPTVGHASADSGREDGTKAEERWAGGSLLDGGLRGEDGCWCGGRSGGLCGGAGEGYEVVLEVERGCRAWRVERVCGRWAWLVCTDRADAGG